MAKNKLRRMVIFAIFRALSFFIFLLPIRLALKVGQYLGRIGFFVLRKQRKIALDNLDIALAETFSLQERARIAREVFENLGRNLVEIIDISRFNRQNIDRYIECKGLDKIETLIKKGKGGIVLSAHLGNWELLAHYFAIKGYSVNVIARRIRAEYFERFLNRIRKRNGVNVLHRDVSAKDVISLLRKNEFVGIMPDQDVDSVTGLFVDFFGRPAYTPNGPAVLNFLTRSSIIPCFIVRKKFGHRILIEDPIELSATGDREKDILENTRRYTKVIEKYIRSFPSQWVWFHERWKTRP